MRVPKGGSNCAKCEYVQGQNCKEEHFIQWNGGVRIPAAVDSYCCDFFEDGGENLKDVKFEEVGL
jgi:hypothetical protein